MQAWIIDSGRSIEPFLEPARSAAWAGTTLGAAVDDALARRGLRATLLDAAAPLPAPQSDAVLVLAGHCFVTDKCLGDFLDAALDVATAGKAARLALARTPAVDFVRPVSSVQCEPFDADGPGARPAPSWLRKDAEVSERCVFDCFLLDPGWLCAHPCADGAALLTALRADAQRVVVAKRELGIPLRMPVLGDAAQTVTVVPITSTVAAHVEHWVHILWLNQLAFGVRWMEIAREHKAWCAWRALCAAPWTPLAPRVMRSFVRRGKGVRIHPTAHVEASILGDGVVIGPRASVRNSIIASGSEVADHATVLSSVLGPRCYVTPRTFLVWSATYEDAVITNYKLQVSLIGRGAAVSTWAGLIDAKLQGSVDVMLDGARRSTERSFLGSCVGHGAYVGAKVLVLPGRSVPNGSIIAMRPDELVADIPADLPAGVPHVRERGTLVPLNDPALRS